MASELIFQLGPNDVERLSSMGYEPGLQISQANGLGKALRFPKNTSGNDGYVYGGKIPANGTLTTGIKFDFIVIDDGSVSASLDAGLAAVFGITVKLLTAGATLDMTSAGTEVTGTVTLASTPGQVAILTIAVANANLNAAVAGSQVLLRFRRLGSNASDTALNEVLVDHIDAYAY
jgi:hypothetical protein